MRTNSPRKNQPLGRERTVGNLRLAAQQVSHQTFRSPGEVVRWMGAVQAQDFAASRWALGMRLPESSDARIEEAIATGEVIRIHALRGTWQLVAPEDVRWLLALCAPRVLAANAGRLRELELDGRTLRKAVGALGKVLRDGASTREELRAALERAGISTEGQRASYLFQVAEYEGLICDGPRRGRTPTYRLLSEVAPKGRALDPTQALVELARRYLQSHGPASVEDFKWWAGINLSEARSALEASRSSVRSEELNGRTLWSSAEAGNAAPTRDALLLPAFDEFLVGYARRDEVLDPVQAHRHNAGGGMLNPVVVLDGGVIGTWKRQLRRAEVALEVEPFGLLSKVAQRKIAATAKRYAAFLGLQPIVRYR